MLYLLQILVNIARLHMYVLKQVFSQQLVWDLEPNSGTSEMKLDQNDISLFPSLDTF